MKPLLDLKETINYISTLSRYSIIVGIMALISVSLAIVDLSNDLSPFLLIIDEIIYIFFVIEYFLRLWAAQDKPEYVKGNLLDLVAIIPFSSGFRMFRAFKTVKIVKLTKLSKLIRLGTFSGRALNKSKTFLNTNGFKYVLFLSCFSIFIAAFAVMYFEKMGFSDALWWSFVTTTTVGYGDLSPSTNEGRIVACILMLVGIGLIGSLTSSITGYFMNMKSETLSISSDKVSMVKTMYDSLNDKEKEEFLKVIK